MSTLGVVKVEDASYPTSNVRIVQPVDVKTVESLVGTIRNF